MAESGVERLALPELIDQLAKRQPETLYCVHPISQDKDEGWRRITLEQLAHTINRLAWWINSKLPRGPGGGQRIIAYIGTNDLRYMAFIVACMKVGHAALLLSTRNSLPALEHLIRSTDCSVLVDATERPQLKRTIQDLEYRCSDSLETWKMDDMWSTFSSAAAEPYPYRQQFADIEEHIALMIHSSGTTGMPKPIKITHGYIATIENMSKIPVPPGRERAIFALSHIGQMRLLHGPLFHIMGIMCLVESIVLLTPFTLAPDRPLTLEMFVAIMDRPDHPVFALLSPYILETIVSSEQGRKALAKLSGLNFGGAPISRKSGDMIASLVRFQTLMGSSETSYTPTLLCKDNGDWGYFEFNPAANVRMEDVGQNMFELILPRPASRQYHGVFHVYPNLKEYRTGDLFRPHSSKPGLWRYEGRGDDIIVLKNGEKLNPIDGEKTVESSPLVDRAIILGQDRFQVSLLIQPHWDALPTYWTVDSLHKSLRSVVDQANRFLPAHGQIFYSHVAFASRDKPFTLSPKGSLRRREIAQEYGSLLDELYASSLEEQSPETITDMPSGSGQPEIEQWLQGVVGQILSQGVVDIDTDIVALGMDSLQVMRLTQILQQAQQALHKSSKVEQWSHSLVYNKATVRRIAEELHCNPEVQALASSSESPSQRQYRLTHSVWQNARFLHSQGRSVILTGSTGELGSYLLDELLKDPSIEKIYCLNRSAEAIEKQRASFEEKGLASPWLSETSRVEFYQAHFDQEYLGLSLGTYHNIQQRVDVVLHNAWPVNFNQPFERFSSQITGMHRLLRFAQDSPRHIDFNFISSIATVSGSHNEGNLAITEALHNVSAVLPQGYAESKFVAESLCGIAAHDKHLNVAIHRVGQLGGPSTADHGMWNVRDWVPSLIKSSVAIGALPDSLGPLRADWVPIDTAAQIMSQIVYTRRSTSSSGLKVYHITNPHPRDWSSILPPITQACGATIVSLSDWIQRLQINASSIDTRNEDLHQVPAVQLIEFFSMLDSMKTAIPPIGVSNTSQASAAMRDMVPIDHHLVGVWLRQWKKWIPELRVDGP
ncbi:hypothetical protein BDV25DRAFT_168634 [Aspergillus avenaceus]|uniref:Carrier domain-containing protein n=1 Tax=Aspergillus avenaceus TaxID=36643 RepID=A0A5N6U4Z5_ASPAV|nr:hypothetical protein BDV25DRAFT_168634 [Aspergillus avenaceus]